MNILIIGIIILLIGGYTYFVKKKIDKEKIDAEIKYIKNLLNFKVEDETPTIIEKHIEECNNMAVSINAIQKCKDLINEHLEEMNHALKYAKINERYQKKLKEVDELDKRIKTKLYLIKEIECESTQNKEILKSKLDEKYEGRMYEYFNKLKPNQIEALKELGFQKAVQWDIFEKKLTEFLIRPRSNESLSHAFVVEQIKEYLIQELSRKSVQIFQTKLPDIVFKFNKQQWAIEVETGSMLAKDKKSFTNKVKMLNKNYHENWFFVVTNKKLLPKYRKFGVAIERSKVIDYINKILST